MTNVLRFALSTLLGLAIAFSAISAVSFLTPSIAGAQALGSDDFFGGSDDFGETAGLGEADLQTTIAQLIRIALGFLGIVAIVIVLMGGFKWMTAGGNDEKVKEAKKLLIAGVIGLAIIISAYAITTFVISSLLQATQ